MLKEIEYKNKVILGNCLDVLKNIPDETVDCIVTSPPYYNLRYYPIEDVIWGGDSNCVHEWNTFKKVLHSGRGDCQRGSKYSEQTNIKGRDVYYNQCVLCGAWKGQLGLEPTFKMFIEHLIIIFSECKRVLKKTGTMWVNISDSYSGSGGNGYKQTIDKVNKSSGGDSFSIKNKYGIIDTIAQKSLCNVPARFAIAMTDELNLIMRNEIVWEKPNSMPSSCKDRFTVNFEKIYFFVKSDKPTLWYNELTKIWKPINYKPLHINGKENGDWFFRDGEKISAWKRRDYYFKQQKTPLKDNSIIRSNYKMDCKKTKFYAGLDNKNVQKYFKKLKSGEITEANMRSVWNISTRGFSDKHYATYPEQIVSICLDAGCVNDGIVLDPFCGSGTTLVVAKKSGRNFIGIDASEKYINIANKRLLNEVGLLL